MNTIRKSRVLFLAALLASWPAWHSAQAATLEWDGGGIADVWSNAFNWNPNVMPGVADDVVIDLAIDSFLDQDFSIRALDLTLGGTADTNGHALTIGSGGIDIALTSQLIVSHDPSGTALQTTGINVNNLGVLRMNGGLARVGGNVIVNGGGTFTGFGQLNFQNGIGAPQTLFTNNGTLSTGRATGSAATDHFTLTLSANDVDARIDLDGASNNRVLNIVENTTLDVDIEALDFWGTTTMAAGSTLDMAKNWLARGTSVFNINAGAPAAGVPATATISGARMNAIGAAQFNVNSGTLVFDAELISGTAPDINVAAGAGLQFNAEAVYDGDVNFNGNNVDLIVDGGDVELTDDAWDWDGPFATAKTTIRNGGILKISGDQLSAAGNNTYAGVIELEDESILRIRTDAGQDGWTLAGTVISQNTSSTPSRIEGDTTINGGLISSQDGLLIMHDNVDFANAAATLVSSGSELRFLASPVTFAGGSAHTGSGRLTFSQSKVTVNGNQTISMPNGQVYLDGNASLGNETYQLNADLTVNASSIQVDNTFGGTTPDEININNVNSTLTVNLTNPNDSWTLGPSGRIHISGVGTLGTSIAGSDLNVRGAIDVDQSTRFTARVHVESTGHIDLNAGNSVLHLNGGTPTDPNTMAGGIIDGLGQISSFGSGLKGFGTVNPDIAFNGGSDLTANGGALVINGNVLAADIIRADASGTLQFAVPLDTSNATALELNGGSTSGATINNNGTTRGKGLIGSGGFVNNGQLIASGGGQLVVNTINAPDLDGNSPGALLQALSADLVIVDSIADAFDGNAAIEPKYAIEFQQSWTLDATGRLFMTGGSTSGTAAILRGSQATLNGAVEVDGQARIEAPSTFRPTGQFNLQNSNDVLSVAANSTLQPGATMTGNGTLANLSGARMFLTDGLDVGVTLRNEGDVAFLGPAGSVTDIDTYVQTASGSTEFKIAGATAGNYDQIIAFQDVMLDGQLAVQLLNGFSPSLNDAFVVLQATTGFVTGQFASTDLPVLSGSLDWQVDYSDPLTVWLRVVSSTISGDFDGNGDYACNDVDQLVAEIAAGTNAPAFDLTGNGLVNGEDLTAWLAEAGAAELPSGNPYLPGDANLDGTVDGGDFLVWNANKFSSDAGWCGGDFTADGTTDGGDFLIWNTNKFQSSDNAPNAVPEPSAITLLGGLLVAAAVTRRSHEGR